jgi:hypothetical protein
VTRGRQHDLAGENPGHEEMPDLHAARRGHERCELLEEPVPMLRVSGAPCVGQRQPCGILARESEPGLDGRPRAPPELNQDENVIEARRSVRFAT